jgi:hypothetical protein
MDGPGDLPLTERECEMLDFERECWQIDGRKDDQIRARFGLSSSSYYRALLALMDRDEAFAYDPLTVKRLRRHRDLRRRVRLEGRRADPGSR